MNPLIQEWKDALGCASVWTKESLAHVARVEAAGNAIIKDYEKAIENLHREASLAVRLRQKLEEVAGPEVASSVV